MPTVDVQGNLKQDPNLNTVVFICEENTEMSHFVPTYPVSKCIWFVFIGELKVCFCFLFVWVVSSPHYPQWIKIIRSSKNTRKQYITEKLNKDKVKMSPDSTMKRDWSLGCKREPWDFGSSGLCCQYLTASLLGCPRLPNQKL